MPSIDLGFGFFMCHPMTLLEPAQQLITLVALASDDIKVIIGQLAPQLLEPCL